MNSLKCILYQRCSTSQKKKNIIDDCVSHLSLSFYHQYRGYDYLIPVIFLSGFYLLLLGFFWVTCCRERQGNTRDLLSVEDNYSSISQYRRILRACLWTTGFFIKKKNTRYEPITQNCQHKEQLIHESGKKKSSGWGLGQNRESCPLHCFQGCNFKWNYLNASKMFLESTPFI